MWGKCLQCRPQILMHDLFAVANLLVDILVSPLLPVCMEHSHHHLPNCVAFEFFSSLLLVYLSFCLQSFYPKSVMSQSVANPSMFPCQAAFSICLSSFTLLRTSSLVSSSSQLIFSILLHIHISKASNLLLSVWVNVSAAYITVAPDQAFRCSQLKHFIIGRSMKHEVMSVLLIYPWILMSVVNYCILLGIAYCVKYCSIVFCVFTVLVESF